MVDVGLIIEYEAGEMTDKQLIEFFAELIKTGECWSLQGHYGRTATALITSGYIDKKGNILKQVD